MIVIIDLYFSKFSFMKAKEEEVLLHLVMKSSKKRKRKRVEGSLLFFVP
jgi:hypothetical protein